MTPPWTTRERALRAALVDYHEFCVGYVKHLNHEAITKAMLPLLEQGAAALADQPPPDPRDAALKLAEGELHRLWKLVPPGRAGVSGRRTIQLEDDEVARLRQIVDAIRAANGGA